MNLYIELTLLALVTVYAVDVSGFTDSWRDALARALHVRQLRPLPPFDCGKCATFWACVIWAAVRGRLGIDTVAFAALCSLLSLPAGQLMLFIREGLTTLIGRLWTTRR